MHFSNDAVISYVGIINYISQSVHTYKGNAIAIAVSLECTERISADFNAEFTMLSLFYGFNTLFQVTGDSGKIIAQVTGNTSANIFNIQFVNN